MRLFVVILMLLPILPLTAKTQDKQQELRQKRYDKIEYYHLTGGLEVGGNKNSYAGIDLSAGLGSCRNLLGADAGIRYTMCNPIKMTNGESLSASHAAIFVSGHLNMLRWQKGSVHIGAEAACNFGVSSKHHGVSRKTQRSESGFHETYGSVRGRLGLMLSRWNVSAYCQYNLAPQMNQKYVFETETFDYDKLHDSLFERVHFGVSVSYSIPL